MNWFCPLLRNDLDILAQYSIPVRGIIARQLEYRTNRIRMRRCALPKRMSANNRNFTGSCHPFTFFRSVLSMLISYVDIVYLI